MLKNLKATRALALVVGLLMIVAAATAATASNISPHPRHHPLTAAARQIARTIAVHPEQVQNAYFSTLPPRGQPAGIVKGGLGGFPLSGKKFGILSTGSVELANHKNNSPHTSRNDGGPRLRGARDLTIMRIALLVPKEADCLSIRFRFLTEEFPEYVGSEFNDFFIAELDHTSWDAGSRTDPTITAPRNFAFDSEHNVISVNAAGAATVTQERAKGTTYDGGTRILRASTKVTPGSHRLYLSLADQRDRIYDSTVLLDKLTLNHRKQCKSGISSADNGS